MLVQFSSNLFIVFLFFEGGCQNLAHINKYFSWFPKIGNVNLSGKFNVIQSLIQNNYEYFR